MKVKLLNVLTVCIFTLAVISPGILAFTIVWGRHIELVKAQNLTCNVNNNSRVNNALVPQSEGIDTSTYQSSLKISEHNLNHQELTAVEQYQLTTILQWFFLITPIFVGLGIILYDRYLVYRTAVFKEQVEMLERLWQQSIEQ
ncbi:MAG: hypothetical protein KME32_14595 [Mojavia pulchra JT2-VF2]|jgi:hypothetical protein|uniref:Transmembrane protein n=1 Tax=Mojavia pulchra JT2-VF2 TaxID=287848 RepID=A0A951Q112_9NOST|nr:hypothetical protein [Mojavia pulchra JT2-VF2]